MIQTNASGIIKRKEHARKGHERMKRRLISLVLVLMLVMTAGCGKKSTTKKLKTEDLDETTLQGMAKDITKEMSLKNKIGQLFMVSVYQLDEVESKNQTSVTSQMKKTLKKPKRKIRTACSKDSPRVPDEKPTHVPCRSC